MFVRVMTGAGARAIGKELEREGVIRSALQFVVWTRVLDAEERLQAGEYRLHPGMAPPAIVWLIKNGRVAAPGLTIPEGYNLMQIAETLSVRGLANKEEFLALANASANVLDEQDVFQPPNNSLEGYLFPDTYRIAPGTQAVDILRLMLDRTRAK